MLHQNDSSMPSREKKGRYKTYLFAVIGDTAAG
jgi:hypothetical protein